MSGIKIRRPLLRPTTSHRFSAQSPKRINATTTASRPSVSSPDVLPTLVSAVLLATVIGLIAYTGARNTGQWGDLRHIETAVAYNKDNVTDLDQRVTSLEMGVADPELNDTVTQLIEDVDELQAHQDMTFEGVSRFIVENPLRELVTVTSGSPTGPWVSENVTAGIYVVGAYLFGQMGSGTSGQFWSLVSIVGPDNMLQMPQDLMERSFTSFGPRPVYRNHMKLYRVDQDDSRFEFDINVSNVTPQPETYFWYIKMEDEDQILMPI